MDVANHFGLSTLPFRATIAPRDAWVGGPFSVALAEILARLRAGEALVALTGPTGTGKSLALRTAAARLGDAGEDVHHFGRADQMADELPTGGILIVDEADASDPDRLRQMAEAAGREFQLVLAGDGDFLAGLRDGQRVTPVRLSTLDANDAAAFVRDRLVRSGKPGLFDDTAIERASELGGGVPRQIGAIAGAALLEAALDGASAVAARHVERAGAMRASFSPSKSTAPRVHTQPSGEAAPAAAAAVPVASPAQDTPFPPGPTRARGRTAARAAAIAGLIALPLWLVLQQPWADAPAADTPAADAPAANVEPPQPRMPVAVPTAPVATDPAPTNTPVVLPEPAASASAPDAAASSSARPASAPPTRAEATGAPMAARSPREQPPRPAVVARQPAAEAALGAEAPRPAPPPPVVRQEVIVAPVAEAEGMARAPEREPAAPATPFELPTVRAEPDAANKCSCPSGMSAARCLEWKAWRACRPRD